MSTPTITGKCLCNKYDANDGLWVWSEEKKMWFKKSPLIVAMQELEMDNDELQYWLALAQCNVDTLYREELWRCKARKDYAETVESNKSQKK